MRRPLRASAGAARSARAATGEEAEPVVESCRELLDREGPQSRRGQLDGERQPIESATQLHDQLDVDGAAVEVRSARLGAGEEQVDGVRDGREYSGSSAMARGGVRDGVLAAHPEDLAAGRQDARVPARVARQPVAARRRPRRRRARSCRGRATASRSRSQSATASPADCADSVVDAQRCGQRRRDARRIGDGSRAPRTTHRLGRMAAADVAASQRQTRLRRSRRRR